MTKATRCGVLFLLAWGIAATTAAEEGPDLEVIHRIKQEAFKHSQVMQHLFYMTDVHGPRLTNSPGFGAAARWVVETAEGWELDNVGLESWAPRM